jgi:NTE family protein
MASMTRLDLALQGGGAHGAFTWGVLDRLLDEPDIQIGRVSGTSAGALNGAALASGMAEGGRTGAKKQLALLWTQVATAGLPIEFFLTPWRKSSFGLWDDALPLVSPYIANPMGMSLLRQVLNSVVNFDALRGTEAPLLYVNAVNVHNGLSRVFGPDEMSVEALLASACAPLLFQAIQIGEDAYWDGSYGGNPMLWPLHESQDDADLLMIELTPLNRAETPTTAKNILNRINEIASINALVSELAAIDRRNRKGASLRVHVLSLAEEKSLVALEPSVKRTVGMTLFETLRQTGRAACERWLAEHGRDLGVRSSADLHDKYLQPYRQDENQ